MYELFVSGDMGIQNWSGSLSVAGGLVGYKGYDVANGVPTLDSSGKIQVSQLPNSVMEYKGTWNVTTNTPTLVNGTGNAGDVYIVVGAASGGTTHDFGAGPILFYNGDQVLYDGSIYERATGATGTVTSVAMSVPTGLTITGSPITTSGTLALGLASGYTIPTTSFLNGLVPYTGATQDVNLGTHGLDTDFVQFTTTPTSGDAIARLRWNNTYGTLNLMYDDGVTTNQIGQQLDYAKVVNQSGATIKMGTLVMVNPSSPVQGNRLSIQPMISNGTYSSQLTVGLVTADITNNGNGYVCWFGEILNVLNSSINLNSETWAVGDILYSDPAHAGGLTHTMPSAPNLKGTIAVIKKISGPNIDLIVRPYLSSKIAEINDVSITSASNKDVLYYDSSTSLWKNASIASILGYMPVTSARTLTINGTSYDLSADRTWNVGTVTSIGLSSTTSGVTIGSSPITTSGTITLSIATASGTQQGLLSSTDWTTFNGKQNALSGTGFVKISGTTISYDNSTYYLASNPSSYIALTALSSTATGLTYTNTTGVFSLTTGYSIPTNTSQTNWDTAYSRSLTSAAVTGTTTKTLTLNQQGGGTITASWSDLNTDAVTSVFGRTGAVVATSGDYTTTLVTEGTNLYYTDSRARGSLSFAAGSGAYNSTTGVITIPTNNNQITNGAGYITLTSLSAGAGISYNNTTGIISSTITQYTDAMARAAISLTTTGNSGAATYNSTTGVLNIPNYSETTFGTVTSVGLSAPTGFSVSGSPVTTSGTLALSFATGYSLPTTASQSNWDTAYTNRITSATAPLSITSNVISISQATTSTNGYLSSTDWNTFNNKQSALTNPITGTGTLNYLPKFTSASTIGNSLIYDNGNIGINTTSPQNDAGYKSITINGTSGGQLGFQVGGTLTHNIYGDASNLALVTIGSTPITLWTNSIKRLTLDASGNVGIGTTSPAQKLTVSDNIASPVRIGINNDNASGLSTLAFYNATAISSWIEYSNSATSLSIWQYQNGYMNFGTNNTERMRITSGGYVGIGTPSPRTILDVVNGSANTDADYSGAAANFVAPYSTNANTGTVSIESNDAYAIDKGGSIAFGGRYTTGTGNAHWAKIAGYKHSATDSEYGGYLSFQTRLHGSPMAERMRITSGGVVQVASAGSLEVGYSAIQGAYKLDVNGTGRFSDALYGTSGTFSSNLTIKSVGISGLKINSNYAPTGKYWNIGVNFDNNDGELLFTPTSSSFSDTKIIFQQNGNVGIGTLTDAGYKLDVNGTGRFTVGTNQTIEFNVPGGNTGIIYNLGATGNYSRFQMYNVANATSASRFFALEWDDNSGGLRIAKSGAATFSSSVTAGGNISIPNNSSFASSTSGNLVQPYITLVDGSGYLTLNSAQTSDGSIRDIVFKQAGSEKARFDYRGYFGIGTTSPASQLGVFLSNTTGGGISLQAISGTAYAKFGIVNPATDNTSYIGSITNNDFAFYTNNTERMRITSGGNVGIGTTNAQSLLTVNGNIIVANGSGYLTNLYYSSGWNYLGNGYAFGTFMDGSGNYLFYSAGNNTSGNNVAASPTERMRITSGGDILFGFGKYFQWAADGTSSSTRSWAIRNNETANGDFAIVSSSTNNNTLNTTRLVITSGGNVLIGTTTDNGQKLQVSGITQTTGLSLSGTTVSTSQTITSSYFMWVFNGASGQTLTLYSPTSHNNIHFIKNSSANDLTIGVVSGSYIETTTSTTTVTSMTIPAYKTAMFISNGGYVWEVMFLQS